MKFNYKNHAAKRTYNNNKFACIDLGSNLCRMIIGFANKKKAAGYSVLKSMANAVRLGDKVYQTGIIHQDSIDRTTAFLEKCVQVAKQYDVKKIDCVVTAACRLANNKSQLIEQIKERTDLDFRIIEADEEIYLSSLGCMEIIPYKYCYVIDMGGCSTEIGLCVKTKNDIHLKEWISLPIGILKFIEEENEHVALDQDSQNILRQFNKRCMKIKDNIPIIIAKSGIMSTLANYIYSLHDVDIKVLHGKIIPIPQIKQSLREIVNQIDEQQHKNTKQVSTKGSAIFMSKILSCISNLSVAVISNTGLREGLLYRSCCLQNHSKKNHSK